MYGYGMAATFGSIQLIWIGDQLKDSFGVTETGTTKYWI